MPHLVLCLVLLSAAAPQGVAGGSVSVPSQGPPPQPRDARAVLEKGTGRISGRVTAADTGIPIRRAMVSLSSRQRRAVYTDHEGRYAFGELPPGQYTIIVNPGSHRADYQTQPYGGGSLEPTGMPGVIKPIELADGQQLENIDIALLRSGAITGTVLDLDGQPLARMRVSAMLIRPGFEPMQRGGGQTDDRGQYRIFGLAPGDYVVRADPMPGGVMAQMEGEATGFAPTYAPGTPVMAEAMRVRLARGGEVPVDIRLMETRVFRITGMLVNSKGEASRNSTVMLARDDEFGGSSFGTSVSPTGEFTLRNVPPGSYEIVARVMPQRQGGVPMSLDDPGQEYASVPVDVGNADVENVLIATRPGATVTGRILFDGLLPEGRRANVFVQTAERRQFMGSPAVEVTDDAFTLKNVFTPILLRGSIGGPGWGLKAVLLRGRDITDEPVAFTEKDSGHLQVIFTSTAPSLEGAVTDHAGKAVPEATILVFGEDPATWGPHSSFFRRSGLDKEGRYKLVGLRDGRYFAVAIPRELGMGMNMTQLSREFLETLAKVGTRVLLNPGETRTVDLPLIRFEQ